MATPAATSFVDRVYINSDIGLTRNIAFRERFMVQFRAQAFNMFNTPQFGLPEQHRGHVHDGRDHDGVNARTAVPAWPAFRFLSRG